MPFPPMNFCSNCGAKVALRVAAGRLPSAQRLRQLQPPSTTAIRSFVVGTIPVWEDRILLCKRAIEPRYGLWTLPAGFMSSVRRQRRPALRETMEEANARVELGEVFTLLVRASRGSGARLLPRPAARPGLRGGRGGPWKVALYREGEIPWKEIAFRTISTTLRHFYADRKAGAFSFHAAKFYLRSSRKSAVQSTPGRRRGLTAPTDSALDGKHPC